MTSQPAMANGRRRAVHSAATRGSQSWNMVSEANSGTRTACSGPILTAASGGISRMSDRAGLALIMIAAR